MNRILTLVICIGLAILGLLIIVGVFDPIVNEWVVDKIGRLPGSKSFIYLKLFGFFTIFVSIFLFALINFILPRRVFIQSFLKMNFILIDSWLKNKLNPFINFLYESRNLRWNSINKWDVLFIVLSILLSCLIVVERLQNNYPNVILGSDAGNIASMAVTSNDPTIFEKDFFLHDQNNYKLYFQFHVFLIKEIGKFLGNYSLPFVIILGPTVFLTLIGNYWLGRTFLSNRIFAFLLVIFNIIPVYLLFENWGLAEDAVPRTLMQALFPFLLSLICIWRDKPNKWPIISILTGLLTYIHAVGTPTVMAIVLLSLLSQMPTNWSFSKKIITLIFHAMIMLFSASLFIFNYLQVKQQVEPVDYGTMINLYKTFFPPDILNVTVAIKKLIDFFIESWLLPLSIFSFIFIWIIGKENRRVLNLLLAGFVGTIIVSIFIPYSERIIESYLRILPLETELIRGTRFFVPLFGLTIFVGLNLISQVLKFKINSLIAIIIGLFFIGHYFTFRSTDLLYFEKTVRCLKSGKILCNEQSDLQKVLIAVDLKTPNASAIFFAKDSRDTIPLAVRYISQRSLVYSWKDRGLGFSKPEKMLIWHENFLEIDKHPTTYNWFLQDQREFFEFAEQLGSDYIIINKENNNFNISELLGKSLYSNETYELIEIFHNPQ